MSLARIVAGAALAASVCLSSHPRIALAQEGASVRIPLAEWQRLSSTHAPDAGPASASIGAVDVHVTIEERDRRSVAVVRASVAVRTRDAHADVLLLPPGVALISAIADGTPIELSHTGGGLAWLAESAGMHRVELAYEIEGARHEVSASIGLALPIAPAVRVHVTLPSDATSATLVPSVGARSDGGVLQATVTGGGGVLLAWHALEGVASPTPSRAIYRGRLDDEAVRFEAELDLELKRDTGT